MTVTNWLLNKNNCPSDSMDLYGFYDEYCEECGHISNETFKRYCRKAVQAYREENFTPKGATQEGAVDREVLLDRLNETENKLELSLKAYKIQDVETAARIAGIDLSKWKCVRKTVRASQNNNTPWFIVEGKFEPIPEDEITPEEFIENFRKMLEDYTPPSEVVKPKKVATSENVALLNLYDHHIGKKIQGDITGNGEEWTTELAKQAMLNAVDYFIDRTKDEVSKAVFVLGNDLLNIDNPQGTTTKGTPQKNDIDFKHLILESTELLITVLDKLLHYFEVEVLVVPGNHDTNLTFMLGEILNHHYFNNESIQIDNGLSPIKYWSFGENAIGFTHGSEQIKKKYVLPMLMLQQRPEFSVCKYKEFHTGHLHQTKKSQLTEIEEEYGVTLRTLPTLSPTCEWAAGRGYQGIQATECIVYNKNNGPIITYRYTD